MRKPASSTVLDCAVLLFACWTLCCHATVLLHGNGNHLAIIAGLAGFAGLAGAGFAWLRKHRARLKPADRTRGSDGDSPSVSGREGLAIIPDDAIDARALLVGAVLVAVGWIVVWARGSSWSTYGIALSYVVVAAAYLLSRPVLARGAMPADSAHAPGLERLLWGLSLLGACITLVLHRDNTDDSFYVNVAVALADHPNWALFSRNTLHGLPGPSPAMYHVASFELLAGTLTRITGIPSLLVVHLILGTLGGIALPLGLARLFRVIEPGRWEWLTLAAFTFYLFDGTTQFGFSMHGFARIYQGKAIMWSVLVPATVAYGIELGAEPSRRRFLQLAAAQIAGIGLSSTGLWLMPMVACVSVLIPFAFDKRGARSILVALASSVYPVLVALWVREQISAPTANEAIRTAVANADEPAFGLISRAVSMVLGTKWMVLSYAAMLVLAPLLASNRLARRYLVAFSFIVVALFVSPFIFDFMRKNVTGVSTSDRGLWLLPLPTAVGLFAAFAVPADRRLVSARTLGAALGAVALAAFYVLLPTRTNMPRGHLRFPPGPKVQLEPFAAAKLANLALPEGAFVVADWKVSVHLPLLHHPPMPVMAKESYFGGVERKRRTALRDSITRKGAPMYGKRAATLRKELKHYRVRGLVLTAQSERTKGMKFTLKRAGFRAAGVAGKYRLWIRELPGAKRKPTTGSTNALAPPPSPKSR